MVRREQLTECDNADAFEEKVEKKLVGNEDCIFIDLFDIQMRPLGQLRLIGDDM